ncbi:hypothetical protein V5799_022410, partial [Amblyomma americanum]
MSGQPPTQTSSAPSLPAQSESGPQESPWQAALKYFNTATNPNEATSQNPPSAGGPFSRLQSALGYLADRALVQTSITIESSSDATASSSATAGGREQPSPIAKALDYVSLSVFAPEMIRSSSSSSSIGVTIVRPLSRSCLRDVRSTPNLVANVPGVSQQRRPPGPRASVPTVRSRYRLRLVPSTPGQPEPPRPVTPTQSEASVTSVTTTQPSYQSGQYYYACNASGQPSSYYVLLPSGASSCRQEHSCCSECRCGYRYPDPLEIFRTFSMQMNSYRNFGLQNPFGMSSILPYWPLPQHPYYFYPPGPIVPSFQTWLSSRSSNSNSSRDSGRGQCEQCAWEARQKRASPAKAVRDFSTLVQAAPSGQQPLRLKNKVPRKCAKFEGQPVIASAMGVQAAGAGVKAVAQEAQGPEASTKASEFLGKPIESDPGQMTAAAPVPPDFLATRKTTDKEELQAPPGSAAATVEQLGAAFDATKSLPTSAIQPSLMVEGQDQASAGTSPITTQAPGIAPIEPQATTASGAQPSLSAEAKDQVSPGLSDMTKPPASLPMVQSLGSLEPQAAVTGSPQQASDNLPFVNFTEQKQQGALEAGRAGAGVSPIQGTAAPSVPGPLSMQSLPQQPAELQPTSPTNMVPGPLSSQSPGTQLSLPQQPAELQTTSPQNAAAERGVSQQPPVMYSMPETMAVQPPGPPQPRAGMSVADAAPAEQLPPENALQDAASEDEGEVPRELSAPTAATTGAFGDDEDTENMTEK